MTKPLCPLWVISGHKQWRIAGPSPTPSQTAFNGDGRRGGLRLKRGVAQDVDKLRVFPYHMLGFVGEALCPWLRPGFLEARLYAVPARTVC